VEDNYFSDNKTQRTHGTRTRTRVACDLRSVKILKRGMRGRSDKKCHHYHRNNYFRYSSLVCAQEGSFLRRVNTGQMPRDMRERTRNKETKDNRSVFQESEAYKFQTQVNPRE
jgi:hypothetical protein